jgi:hypothetical protein
MSNLQGSLLLVASAIFILSIDFYIVRNWNKSKASVIGKAIKSVFIAFNLLITLTLLFIAYEHFNNYFKDDRIRPYEELDGVNINWSKDELLFRKGEPDKENPDEDLVTLGYGRTAVVTKSNKIIKVFHYCAEDDYYYAKFGGITCASSVEDVEAAFGRHAIISNSKDKLLRIYNYPEYNIAFLLQQSKVRLVAIYGTVENPKGIIITK